MFARWRVVPDLSQLRGLRPSYQTQHQPGNSVKLAVRTIVAQQAVFAMGRL